MPIHNYGVVRGRCFERVLATKKNEHYQILVNKDDAPHRVAINTESNVAPSEVLYYADLDYKHPITDAILQANLPLGYTAVPSQPGGLALDFIRTNLFSITDMKPLPATSTGDSNDLNDQLDLTVQQAISDTDAVLFAFGQHWTDTKPDQVFPEINPSIGIHDIHMNQGNPVGKYSDDNGPYQDGALLFYFPSRNRWAAVFTAFQSQSFHTNDQTGDPITASGTTTPENPENSSTVVIDAAMVNPSGDDPGKEYVLLLNKGSEAVDLSGWSIADAKKHKDKIGSQTIPAGGTLSIKLSGQGAQLSNKGGIITLLNPQGLKVDGVTYTKADASKEGVLVDF